jgi:hypothetical protein
MSTLLQSQLLSARIQHAVSVASGTQEWGWNPNWLLEIPISIQ